MPWCRLRGTWTLPLVVIAGVVLWALLNEAVAHVIARQGSVACWDAGS
jgi:hypothetical protein